MWDLKWKSLHHPTKIKNYINKISDILIPNTSPEKNYLFHITQQNRYLKVILNLGNLAVNSIHNLLERWHCGILCLIPCKPMTKIKFLVRNKVHMIKAVKLRDYLVRYESTGTPSTVRELLRTPETLSNSSIWRRVLEQTPSMKLFDCKNSNFPHQIRINTTLNN